MVEQLKHMKEKLADCVASQLNGNLEQVQTKELGEVIDMIKDLSKAIYYCTVTDAMEQKDLEERYGSQSRSAMYYDGRSGGRPSMPGSSYPVGTSGPRYFEQRPATPALPETRDYREGRSPMYRKMYMDGKGMKDKTKSMQELDTYMQELSSDIVEMVQDASPEEKQLLQQKVAMLASKIK